MRKLFSERKFCDFWVENDLGRFVEVQEVFLKQKEVISWLALCFGGYSLKEASATRAFSANQASKIDSRGTKATRIDLWTSRKIGRAHV